MKRKKHRGKCILYISQYFPPEVNAPANRVYEMAKAWIGRGRKVKVLTGFPNHPNGVIPKPYRRKIYMCESISGIDVHRCWIYAAPNKGFVRRIASYLSFMFSAIIFGLGKIGRVDCVIATSPQLFVAVAGWIISLVKRTPFLFEVRDLWPEEIVAVGAIKHRGIIGLLEKLEIFLYRRADRIIAVAEGTIEILTRRGIPPDKFTLIPNGVEVDRFARGRRHNRVRDKLNLNGDFLVSYIGTVGMAHKLDVFLEAARLLRDTPRLKFLIVGDGAEKHKLLRRKHEMALDNVLFLDQQPREKIASFYHASDCCLVHLRRADLFLKNIPSKIFEIMACGKPILLGTRGESKRLVSRARCGVFFEPDNAGDLADGIRLLQSRPQWRKRLGSSGYQFVRRHYSRAELADYYLAVLDSVMEQKRAISTQHTSKPVRHAQCETPRPVSARRRVGCEPWQERTSPVVAA